MTMDFVAERLGHANFLELLEIDLPHCELRTIDVGNGDVFRNLRRFATTKCHVINHAPWLSLLNVLNLFNYLVLIWSTIT